MISKNDVVLLLTELQDNGIDIQDSIIKLFKSESIPLSVIKFINDHRQLDLTAFYEYLRKSYNNKKSKLYISIVKEIENPEDVITTLFSFGLQATLYSKRVEDSQMFLKHARVREITIVLTKYFTGYDLEDCLNLLKLIKADLVACETISGRRNSEAVS